MCTDLEEILLTLYVWCTHMHIHVTLSLLTCRICEQMQMR